MDIIEKKLELIDKKLSISIGSVHEKIIQTAPLVFITVGLIIGITLQNYFTLPLLVWLIILVTSSLLAAITFFLYKSTSSKYIIAYTALLCFICLGAIRLTSFYKPEPNDIRNLVGSEKTLAAIKGIIVTEPYINRHSNWKFAHFKFTDPATSFYLKITDVQTTTGWANVSGTVRVQVQEPVIDLKAGDYIQLYCWLERFTPPTNPGQFDTAKYLARKNVFIAASIKSRDGIELLKDRPAGSFTKIKSKFKNKATQALLGSPFPENQSEGLLQALLLGYRVNIDGATYEAFRKTGLLHFISLSGMHLGILVGIIWWLCKTIGLMKRGRAIVCIIAICVFLLIVPPRAPTVRAAIIGWVFCLSFFFRRQSNSINTLSLAAIILLLIKPTDLFEAGWQLSFASVLGLLLFCRRIHFFLYEKITGSSWFKKAPKTRPFFRIVSRPGPYLLRLFSTSLTAWLGGAGILLYHFYTINPLTSIWAVIVFPLVAAILTIGYLKIILSFLLPTAAWVLGAVVTGFADLLIRVVRLIAHLDISHILIGHISIAFIVIYYLIIIFIGFFHLKHQMLKRAISTTLILTLLISLSATKWNRTYRDNLTLTCLDVSHGQAILAQLPGKTNFLFDAGSLYKSDPGRRIILPFFRYAGVNKIDNILISHNDVDHINAIPEITENCKVGNLFANNAFFETKDQWGTLKFLNDQLTKNGYNIERLDNINTHSPAKIKILWPVSKTNDYQNLSDNDNSLVSLIEFAERKILLCSDIEKFAQQMLLQLYPNLKADIVIVPHHGSINTLDLNFLKKLNPSILVCSCGQTQYEKNALKSIKGKKFYTATDGAITISINHTGKIKQDTFLKQKAAPDN